MGGVVKAGGLLQSCDTTGWWHLQELREKEVSASYGFLGQSILWNPREGSLKLGAGIMQ